MGEILPDGSVQSGYGAYCKKCGKEIKVNIQGAEIGEHKCCKMTEEEKQAYDWAINQKFQSVAARYARKLAGYIQRTEGN